MAVTTLEPRPAPISALVERMSATHLRALVVLALVAFFAFLPGFFTIPPTDRDESRFAQATRQMVESGNYVDIRLQEDARHKKPIGIYWLQAAAVHLSGYGAAAPIWVYRIPSLLGAIGGVLLVYWALLPLLGRRAAFVAGLLTASTILLGVEARIAKTDAVLFGVTVAAMGALVRVFLDPDAERRRWAPWIFWGAIGVGILIKGPITLMVAALTAATLSVWQRSARWLLALRPLAGVALASAICAPWLVAIAIESGGSFFRDSIGGDMLAKVGDAPERHWGPPGYYTAIAWFTTWPVSPFLLLGLPWLWRNRGNREIVVLAAWLFPTWLVFEAVSTKLPHYILPTVPALAGLAALAITSGAERTQTLLQRIFAAGLWVLPAALGIAGAGLLYWSEGTVSVASIAFAAVAVAAGLAGAALARRSVVEAVPLACIAAMASALSVFQFTIPGLQSVWLSPRMALAARTAAHCPNPMLASAAYHEPSLVFLTRTDLVMANGASAADFLAAGGCRLAFVDEAVRRRVGGAEIDGFRARAAELGIAVEQVAVVEGRNVNGGNPRRFGLWRLRQQN